MGFESPVLAAIRFKESLRSSNEKALRTAMALSIARMLYRPVDLGDSAEGGVFTVRPICVGYGKASATVVLFGEIRKCRVKSTLEGLRESIFRGGALAPEVSGGADCCDIVVDRRGRPGPRASYPGTGTGSLA